MAVDLQQPLSCCFPCHFQNYQPIIPMHPWPAQVLQAKANLNRIFLHATQALQTESDVSHLQFHHNVIAVEAVSILNALDALAWESSQNSVLLEWVVKYTVHFGTLLCQLSNAQDCNWPASLPSTNHPIDSLTHLLTSVTSWQRDITSQLCATYWCCA